MEILQLLTSNVQFYYKQLPFDNINITNRIRNYWDACAYIINYKGMSKIMKLYDYEQQMFNFNIDTKQPNHNIYFSYSCPNRDKAPVYLETHSELNINNEYLISDYFIYAICNTKILNIPLINTSSALFVSTIDNSQDHINCAGPWEIFINNYRDIIISIIRYYKPNHIKNNREDSNNCNQIDNIKLSKTQKKNAKKREKKKCNTLLI
jgi:hypothetical protein